MPATLDGHGRGCQLASGGSPLGIAVACGNAADARYGSAHHRQWQWTSR
ncbi:hypothetical protein [Chloroflexus sp.]|nr:hypothetical protein [Chloroflexus sp.]